MKNNFKRFPKVASFLCAIAILLSSFPMIFGVVLSDENDGVTVYDFESDSGTHVGKDETFTTEDGTKLYYLTNTLTPNNKMCDIIEEDDGNKVLKVYNSKTFDSAPTSQQIQNFSIYSQILLNDKNGVYELEAGKQYVISFRYKVTASCSYSNAWAKPSFMTLTKGVRSDSTRRIYSTATVFENTVDNTNKKENYKVIENFYGANPTITQWDGTNTGTNPVALGEWQTFTCSFTGMDKTVLSDGTTFYPYLGLYMVLAPGAEICFDDFEICTKSTITFNANGGSINGDASVDVSGEIGEEFSVATPERKGYIFAGWFSDSDCTVPVSSNVFPAQKSVTYYADWYQDGVTVYDFESGSGTHVDKDQTFTTADGTTLYYLTNTLTPNNKMCDIIEEDDGNKVLKVYNSKTFDSTPTAQQIQNNSIYPQILLNDKNGVYELEAGKQYVISFRYKVTASCSYSNASAKPSFMTLTKGVRSDSNRRIYSTATVFENTVDNTNKKENYKVIENFYGANPTITQWDGANTGTNPVALGEWQTFTCSFTGMDKTVLSDGTTFYPYLGLYMVLAPGAEICFDDFEICTKSTITFNANGGSINGDASVDVSGEIGEEFSVATPERKGYTFAGWFSDADCTVPVSGNVFPAQKSVTYYADWYQDGVTVYDFESDSGTHVGKDQTFTTADGTTLYYLTNTITPSTKMCDIIEEDGNKVLKVYNSKTFDSEPTTQQIQNNAMYPQILLNDNNGVYELEAGKQYVISFRYKVTASCSYSNAWAKPSFMTLTKGVRSDSNRRIYSTATVFENTVDATNKKEEYKVIENFYGENPTITQWDGITNNKNKNTGTNPVALGEWQTFTCSFTGMDKTVLSDGTTFYPYLGLYMVLAPGAEICFDDFEITKASTEPTTTKVIAFETNGGEAVESITANVGDSITLPPAKREGYVFYGWYTDSEFENEASQPLVVGESDITLYAKWYKKGNVNLDDNDDVNICDLVCLESYIDNEDITIETNPEIDIDTDGTKSIGDLEALRKILLGIS